MSFSHDRRGQSVVVGTVILFGFLILALASYQAFAVPAQNNAAEFEHSQDVQSDMEDLRASLLDIRDARQNRYQRPVRVGIGFRYDTRLFAVNPPPPEGALSTQDRGNLSITDASVVNEQDFENTGPLFDREHPTRLLTYRPNYNEYQNPPRTTFEHSLLYNRFEGPNQTVTGQRTIDGEDQQLSLIAYSGEINRQGLSTTLDPETVDGPTPTIPIEPDEGETTFEIELPTHSPEVWVDLLADEENVQSVVPNANSVTIELEGEWDLQMTRVGYDGGSVADTPFSNVTVETEDQEGGDLNRTYDVSWDDTDQLSVGYQTVSGTVESNGEPLDNATVDFATNSSVATFQGENTSTTTVDGEFITNVTTTQEGTARLFAASGDDVDQVEVEISDNLEAEPSFNSLSAEVTDYNSGQDAIREININGDVENVDNDGAIEVEFTGDVEDIDGDTERQIPMANTFNEDFDTGSGNTGPSEVGVIVRLLDEAENPYLMCTTDDNLTDDSSELTLSDFTCD